MLVLWRIIDVEFGAFIDDHSRALLGAERRPTYDTSV